MFYCCRPDYIDAWENIQLLLSIPGSLCFEYVIASFHLDTCNDISCWLEMTLHSVFSSLPYISTPPTPSPPSLSLFLHSLITRFSFSSCSPAKLEQSKRWTDESKTFPETYWKMGIETSRHQLYWDSSLCLSDASVTLRRAWWFQFAIFPFWFVLFFYTKLSPIWMKEQTNTCIMSVSV